MTGNLTAEDLIRMATAHFDGENLYEAVKMDDNDEDTPVLVVKKGGTRGADWFKCWKVMRKLDKFSGVSGAAATAAAARGRRPLPEGGVEDFLDDGSSSPVGNRRGLFQERPIDTKAAKAAAATDIAIQKEAATTVAALKSLSERVIERANIDFWEANGVRETGEAEQWRQNEMERWLLLSNARLRKAKAAESRLASRSTTTAPSISATSTAVTVPAVATGGAAASGAPDAAASPASAASPSGGAAVSPEFGRALATSGGADVKGREAAALAPTVGRMVGPPRRLGRECGRMTSV